MRVLVLVCVLACVCVRGGAETPQAGGFTAVVVGATGAVGRHVVGELLLQPVSQ
jgi:hypothetical protein